MNEHLRGNGCEPILEDHGRSKYETDSDGHEKAKVGMVRAHGNKREYRKDQTGCRDEDGVALEEDQG